MVRVVYIAAPVRNIQQILLQYAYFAGNVVPAVGGRQL
jgi:hypothetical protein